MRRPGRGQPAPGPTARPEAQDSARRAELRRLLRERASGAKIAPVSFAQERLWLLEQVAPGSAAYCERVVVRIDGELDPDRFLKALNLVVHRHEILRTSFPSFDGRPVQRVAPSVELAMPVVDLSDRPADVWDAEIRRLAEEQSSRPFELTELPLLRVTLVRLGPGRQALISVIHHIVADGWSMRVFLNEILTYVLGEGNGSMGALPEPPVQYADFARWQREQLQGDALNRLLVYWENRLRDLPVLELPTDRPRPALASDRGSKHTFDLPPGLCRSLRALAVRQGVSLHMALLAVFQTLLGRYSGQTDVVVGSPVAGRDRAELSELIGFFVNMLVLRTDLSGRPTFQELLGRVRETCLGAYDHDGLPFERLVGHLRPGREEASPLFHVAFASSREFVESTEIPGFECRWLEIDNRTSKFDLTLFVWEGPERLRGYLEYRTDLFDAPTIARMADHFRTLLESVVADPSRRLDELPAMGDSERRQVLEEWNVPRARYETTPTLARRFETQVARAPDSLALTCDDTQLSYGELNRRANRLAHRLIDLGVGPESRVALCLRRASSRMIGVLGVLKAGGAYVPLEPDQPSERLAFMAQDASADVIVSDGDLPPALAATGAREVRLDNAASDLSSCVETDPAERTHPENAAYVIYTSGSTGRPKGVVVTHGNVARLMESTESSYAFGSSDVWTLFHSYAFDFSVWEMWGALLYGGRLVVAPYWVSRSPSELLDLLVREQVTVLNQTPSAFRQLTRAEEERGEEGAADLALRLVIFGGEALEFRSLKGWFDRHDDGRPRLVNMYGITETTVHVTYRPVRRSDVMSSVGSAIGRPLDDLDAYVLDVGGNPLPVGVPGELYVGGAGLARGYLGRSGLTAERFVPDPFGDEPGARLYRTGDRVRWMVDGTLEYLGRVDAQVKLRGHRIEPGEIESVLAGHASVRESVVVVREDRPGDRRLVAYVVASNPELSSGELRGYLGESLPDYMIPAAFVVLESLPLTSNGKVDRRALPMPEVTTEPTTAVAPRTEVEQALCSVWSSVLGVDRVGIHDSFFELGGDSILAIQVVSGLARSGWRVTPRQLFEHPTVSALAAVVERAEGSVDAAQGPVTGPVPLTPVQRWLLSQELDRTDHFNQSLQLELREALDPVLLERAAEALVTHHDALRLRLARTDTTPAGWAQHNAGAGETVRLHRIDLSGLSQAQRERALESSATALQSSLDLGQGPLLRLAHYELGEEVPDRLLLVAHHLAVDGVSWRILVEDLLSGYEQLRSTGRVDLGRKTTSYRGWSERLESWSESETLVAESSYWADAVSSWSGRAHDRSFAPDAATTGSIGESNDSVARLSSKDAPLGGTLPRDHARGCNDVSSSRTHRVELDASRTRELLHESGAAYRTSVEELLLTALSRTVGGWTGSERVWVELEGHGREDLFADVDLSRTVGWFTTLYPVGFEASGADAGTQLKSVKQQLREVPRRGIGYGVLRWLGRGEASERLRDAGSPELSFNYLGRFDLGALGSDSKLRLLAEPLGQHQAPGAVRPHVLSLNAAVADGRLQVGWTYSTNLHDEATIAGLASRFMAELEALIAHCMDPASFGCTPSDFPLAGLDQQALDTLVDRGVEDVYPLTPVQSGMLFHSLYAPERGDYFEQVSCRLSGVAFDASAFRQAWDAVVSRHAVLRTQCVWDGLTEPLQVVRRSVALPWDEQDWRGLDDAERAERLEDYLREDRQRGTELDRAPLMRLALMRESASSWRLVWSHHHVLLDGWSLPLLLGEVVAHYEAATKGKSLELGRPRPYRDYVGWLRSQDLGEAEDYWRETLAGFSEATPIDLGRDRLPREDSVHAEESFKLTAEPTRKLEEFGRAAGVTLGTVVQGAWALLLGRYSGSRDVVFGTTVSGRSGALAGMDEMVGLFINTLPLRVRIDGRHGLADWLRDLQDSVTRMRQHEQTPLAAVHGWSDVPRGETLFDSLVVFENYPVDRSLARRVDGLAIDEVRSEERTNYPLTLIVVPGPELSIRVGFDPRRFAGEGVGCLCRTFRTLLESVVADPSRRLDELPAMGDSERRQVLEEWNAPRARYETTPTLARRFETQVARAPDSLALTCDDTQLSYGELNRRANRLAHRLIDLGVGPESRVALCLRRASSRMIGVLGVLKAGGAYVPLEPDQPSERLAFMAQDASADVIVSDGDLPPALAATGAREVRLDNAASDLSSCVETDPAERTHPENAAYVIYTSGSTGRPKGVVVTHGNVARLMESTESSYAFGSSDVWTLFHSYAFDFSVWEMWGALLYGGRLVVAPYWVSRSPSELLDLLVREQVTVLNQTPSAFRQLTRAEEERGEEGAADLALRLVIFGGEALEFRSLKGWFDRHDDGRPRLVNMYGITETTVHVTYRPVRRSDVMSSVGSAIGRPLDDLDAYVLDVGGNPLPVGVPGELYVGGAGLARGYLGRSGLTAERFVPDPFGDEPGARLYRTGDRVRWMVDGTLEYLGRVDAQVKLRGHRIEPGEIESMLAGHASVRESVVVVREDRPGDRRLVAYVVSTNEPLAPAQLRAHLSESLPDYMVPSAIVVLDTLPLTSNGKLDRRSLPMPEAATEPTTEVAPRTEVEQALCSVWSSVLGVDRVGIHDSFFELGGDSILAIQVVSGLARSGWRVTPRQLFEHPTVSALAAVVDRAEACVDAAQGPVTGPVPLTPVQRWLLSQELDRTDHFNQSLQLELREALEPALLERAAQALVAHHDALRLRFEPPRAGSNDDRLSTETGWRQHNANVGETVRLQRIDLSGLSQTQRATVLESSATALQSSLDLSQGPLLRVAHYELGGAAPDRLLLVAHHLAVDGVSWRILVDDLLGGYEQLRSTGRVDLGRKTTSYLGWSERLESWSESETLVAESSYWVDAVSSWSDRAHDRSFAPDAATTGPESESGNDSVARLNPAPCASDAPLGGTLPRDHARGCNDVSSSRTHRVELDASRTRELLHESGAAYRTSVEELLLTALSRTVGGWTGSDRVWVELEGHGREDLFADVDLSRTVGWFTTLYPVGFEASGADAGTQLKSVKQQLREVPRRGIGYGVLRWLGRGEASARLRDAGSPELSFNYLGRFDLGALGSDSKLRLLAEPLGQHQAPGAVRPHVLSLNAAVADGRLQVGWTYSTNLHDEATIAGLASRFMAELEALIAHCMDPASFGCTPSDFPLAGLDQQALDTLVDRGVEDVYPLTPVQSGMLFHSLYAPERGDYFEQVSCRLSGVAFDASAFRQAWDAVVSRHAVLRTQCVWDGLTEPLQVVRRSVALPWDEQDWRGFDDAERAERLEDYLREDRQRGTELDRAPLMRLALMRESASSWRLVWSHHHVLLDGWSLPLLLGEVVAHYEAATKGKSLELGRPRPYRDYVGWLRSQDLGDAEDYWRETLAGFSEATPIDLGRGSGRPGEYGEWRGELSSDDSVELERYARSHGLTLGTLVQGAWALLLGRYSGGRDVMFGTTVSGRSASIPGVEETIGLFINTLPVRARIDDGLELLAWLQDLQASQTRMRQYEQTPLPSVQGWSEVPRGETLFDSLVVFENYPVDRSLTTRVDGLAIDEVRSEERTNYPLTLMAMPGERLTLRIGYDAGRFAADGVDRLSRHLTTLLRSMVSEAGRVSDVSLMDATERLQVLETWNRTSVDYPRDRTVTELFEAQAQRTPDAPAVVHGEAQLTYGELQRRANRLAHRLIELGVGPEQVVGLWVDRSVELVLGVLGILKAGGAYLPLDPGYPRERIDYMLADAGVQVLVTLGAPDDLAPDGVRIVRLDPDHADTQVIARYPDTTPTVDTTPDNLAYVIYTSGSTGRPKGTLLPHSGVASLAGFQRRSFDVTSSSRVLQFAPSSYDASVWEMVMALAHGASLVLAPRDQLVPGGGLEEILARHRVTHATLPPSVLTALDASGLEDLRTLIAAGERCPGSLVQRLGPGRRLFNAYGPTETTVCATMQLCAAEASGDPSIGGPIDNTQAYVLDANQEPLPVGIAGELYVGGAGVARGYLGRADLTAERFVPDPFGGDPGARLYRTGDRARWLEDGTLAFLGRVDTQVKLRGHRIEPGEIESVLAGHTSVRESAVVVREDRPGNRRLVAYVVATEDAAAPGELRAYLAERLPSPMVPSAFVALESLPLTSNGKVDRRALPAPGGDRPELADAYVAPRTEIERALCTVWQSVLGVDRVGIHDSFFELGGDSILAIQVVSGCARAGWRVTPRQLFEQPTVSALAAVVERAEASVDAVQGPVTGPVPLTPVQRWLLSQELDRTDHFNQSLQLELREALDPMLLERAAQALLRHHDALRLRFETTPAPVGSDGDGRSAAADWRQYNAEVGETLRLQRIDLSGLPQAQRATVLESSATALQSSLDLGQGPLLRLAHYELGGAAPDRLLLVAHHLAVDGVSWRILVEDLLSGYEQLQSTGRVDLGRKTTSYQAWSERLESWSESETLVAESSYWADAVSSWSGRAHDRSFAPDAATTGSIGESNDSVARLSSKDAPLGGTLPRDHARGCNDVSSSRTHRVELDASRTRELLHDSGAAYRTSVEELLLTALSRTVGGWTGSDRVWVELEGHGREDLFADVDLSRTVGWFTTLYPVGFEASGADAGTQLKSVKQQLREVPRRGIGYGVLRWLGRGEASARLRDAGSPELSFNYLGRFDLGALGSDSKLRLLAEPLGQHQAPGAVRPHVLSLNAAVADGRLQVGWTYSTNLHDEATIAGLAQRFMAELEALIAHCMDPASFGCTPSDFPLAGLDQQALDTLVDRGVEDVYPLTPVQSGMLFHSLYAPERGDYFEQVSCRLSGVAFDASAFRQAWDAVVSRHAVLRTQCVWDGLTEPLQVVRRSVALPWDEQDWRGLDDAERAERLESYLREDRQRGIELDRAPLMRLALMRESASSWRLVWSHHHVLLDGWSLPLLLGEVVAHYEATTRGKQLELGRPRPYRDYVAWLNAQDLTRAEDYWRETLAGFSEATPIDLGRGSGRPGEYGEWRGELSSDDSVELERYARSHGLTLGTLVQGAWALLLGRYSGSRDVMFGTTVSGRSASIPGVEETIGLFINTLPVRARIDDGLELLAWLQDLQASQTRMRQYEQTPLPSVQGWSEVPRGETLFDSLVVFENYPVDRSLAGGIEGLAIDEVRSEERTNYPLTLMAMPGERLTLRIGYDAGRFAADGVARLSRHLTTLLRSIVSGANRVSDVSLMDAAERLQVLETWNRTSVDYPRDRTVTELFEAQAQRTPDAPAVVHGEAQLTYGELQRRANRLAHRLIELGVGPEQVVGLWVDRSVELVLGVLGILKAGGAYLPLDPGYPRERTDYMLADAGVQVLVTLGAPDDLAPDGVRIVRLDPDHADTQVIARYPDTTPTVDTTPDNLAYVIYTSGSTGRPKGVAMRQGPLANLIAWQLAETTCAASARTLQFASPGFDVSFQEVLSTLAAGGALVIAPQEARQDPDRLLELVAEQGVSRLFLPFVALNHLAEAALRHAPPRLSEIVTAGEQLRTTAPIVDLFRRMPGCVLHNQYGPTESHVVTAKWLRGASSSWHGLPSIGRPIHNARVYVLDRDLEPVPVGVAGELFLGGTVLARGYLGRPDLTAERFLPDPFATEPGAVVYRTGDLARRTDEGEIDFLGRVDHQIKIRGHRIEPGEVEATLERHPAVARAVVHASQGTTSGDRRLVGYVVTGPVATSVEELRNFLLSRIPEFMVPTSFVFLDAVPMLPNGKVDRRSLPAPEPSRIATAEYVAPRSATEQRLAGHWAEVLGVDRVGIHDSFFELGGHSLLATQVASRAGRDLGVSIPLRELFENPTVAGFAAAIERVRGDAGPSSSPIVAIPRTGDMPLSFAQKRLWFLDRLVPGTPLYNIPVAVRIAGPLDRCALQASIDRVVARHESLRTTFHTDAGRPVQRILDPAPVDLEIVDLERLDPQGREAAVRSCVDEDACRSFDLSSGPLLTVRILRLESAEHVLVFAMHHIISDGWSIGVLVRELVALYAATTSGQQAPIPELPVQYADFAAWQRDALTDAALAPQLDYWTAKLEGIAPLALPTDRPRPPVRSVRGGTLFFDLPAELRADIEQLGERHGATSYMVFLAAIQTLLGRLSGTDDVAVGSPIAGRTTAETENLIGFFVNTLVMRTDLSGNPGVGDLISQVREMCVDAYANQDLPFERLVEVLRPDRDLARDPLFQVMFVMQNTPMPAVNLPAGTTVSPVEIESPVAKFDLTFFVTEQVDGFRCAIEYGADLFERSSIERLARSLKLLLETMVGADSMKRLSDLGLMDAAEREQVLETWNRTSVDYPRDRTVTELFEAQAQRTPDAPAVVHGEAQLTYGELQRRANRLAHRLIELGVGPEQVVGLWVDRSVELVLGVLGILKAGGAYLPLDPGYPRERIDYMLADAGVQVLVTLGAPDDLASDGVRIVRLDPDHADTQVIAGYPDMTPTVDTTPDNLAYVIYTSGSTGRPKGTLLPHSGVASLAGFQRRSFDVTSSSRVLQFAPSSYDASVWEMVMALAHGASLVLAPRDQLVPGGGLEEILARHRVTHATLPPSVLTALDASGLEDLRTLIAAGERCPVSLVQRLGPGRRLFNAYGPTETTVCATMQLCAAEASGDPSIGGPIDNTQAYVLDANQEPLPVGIAGELYVGGAGVARGYLGRADLTAERFVPDPFGGDPGARLYRTGDRARWLEDGTLAFLGRVDTQVKLRGHRIEPGEIESVLAGHTSVRESAVVVREDRPGNRRLVAYVVATEDAAAPGELRAYLAERLPSPMVPSAFVALESLPLTSNGKVDRRALPAPGGDRPELTDAYVAPHTEVEQALCSVWSSVLGVDRVGIHDSFFELGGHSMLALEIVDEIRDRMGTELPLVRLFHTPTVAGLAAAIEGGSIEAEAPDLASDAILEPSIRACDGVLRAVDDPRVILLTGATGFLGAFLLHELLERTEAEVRCLVRSGDPDTGRVRIRRTLESYGLWDPTHASRIVPVPGDLSRPLLGLTADAFAAAASSVEAIYHNGAQVHSVYPYSALKASNVGGTVEVLRLASRGRLKPVHYVSTLSVFGQPANGEAYRERDDIGDGVALEGGYAQSKWVAERLVAEAGRRGIPVAIYRPGRITGSSRSGTSNTDDVMSGFLRGMVRLGRVPELDAEMTLDMTPVDFVSGAIVQLARRRESLGRAFHLVNPRPARWKDLVAVVRSFGYELETVPFPEWDHELSSVLRHGAMDAFPALRPLYETLPRDQRGVAPSPEARYECSDTLRALAGTPVHCAPADRRLLRAYLSFFVERGHLPDSGSEGPDAER